VKIRGHFPNDAGFRADPFLARFDASMIIRCTKKIRAEFPLDEKDLLGSEPAPARLDEWFSDPLRSDRQKYVLCTHVRTLFSVVLPQLPRADMAHLATMFEGTVTGAMERERFTPAAMASVVSLDEIRPDKQPWCSGLDKRHRVPVSGTATSRIGLGQTRVAVVFLLEAPETRRLGVWVYFCLSCEDASPPKTQRDRHVHRELRGAFSIPMPEAVVGAGSHPRIDGAILRSL
jgi:hypothetical protein